MYLLSLVFDSICRDEEGICCIMEKGESLGWWYKNILRKLKGKNKLIAIYDTIAGVCSVVFFLGTVAGVTMNDLTPANLLAFELESLDSRAAYILGSNGLGPFATFSQYAFKLTGFEHAFYSVPHRFSSLPSPEYCCLPLLAGRSQLMQTNANDSHSSGRIIMTALNDGHDLFYDDDNNPKVCCPKSLVGPFTSGIDLYNLGIDVTNMKDLAVRVKVQRILDSFYHCLLATDFKQTMQTIAKENQRLVSVYVALRQNDDYKEDVKKYCLRFGSETLRIRENASKLFKSLDAGIEGLAGLMHPLPQQRWAVERFMTMCKSIDVLKELFDGMWD